MRNFIKRRIGETELKDQIDALANHFYNDFYWPFSKKGSSELRPAIELKELKKHFVVKLEVPGFQKGDLSIQVDDQVLTIEGEKRREKESEENEIYHYSEVSYGKFQRIIQLPKAVNVEQVRASFQEGSLKITLKKAEETKNCKVTIE